MLHLPKRPNTTVSEARIPPGLMVRSDALLQRVSNHAGWEGRTVLRDAHTRRENRLVWAPQDQVGVRLQ